MNSLSFQDTARAFIIKDNKLLVMERWRLEKGTEIYYISIPGGKIEAGETPEQAAIRELYEEMTLRIKIDKLIAKQTLKNGITNYYFLGEYISGTAQLNPESAEAKESEIGDNRYRLLWVDKSAVLKDLPLHSIYEPLRPLILKLLAGNIPAEPWQIKQSPGIIV